MSEFEFCEFLRDIAYKNGAGDKRALRAEWLRGIELMNLSFYDRANGDDGDELIFAEDFDLQTTIKLRDWLTEIINAAAIIADQAENAASCEFGEAAPTSHENK